MKYLRTGMGTVVLSLDAELAWGSQNLESPYQERINNARTSWMNLIDLFEEYQVPATWAIVGHLFLISCDGVHHNHPAGTEWFERDPGGKASNAPAWFGRDLIRELRTNRIEHEIASHSFSHVDFLHPDTTPEVVREELIRCRDLAEEMGINLESFIFPRNRISYKEILVEHGFTAFRGHAPNRWYNESVCPRPLGKLATYLVNRPAPPIVDPFVDESGLVNVPASMYLFGFEGFSRQVISSIADDPVTRQAKAGVDKVIEDGGVLHLWLHPCNLTSNSDFHRIKEILDYIARHRDANRLSVKTMRKVANSVR